MFLQLDRLVRSESKFDYLLTRFDCPTASSETKYNYVY